MLNIDIYDVFWEFFRRCRCRRLWINNKQELHTFEVGIEMVSMLYVKLTTSFYFNSDFLFEFFVVALEVGVT